MDTKIIAIGGGEIGGILPNGEVLPVETKSIDLEILKQTGKKKPKLLFIPTASNDSAFYYSVFKKYFKKLGAKVDVLNLLTEKNTKKTIKDKILSSDAIYVGGGNTLKMMTVWRKLDVDKLLIQAHKKGIILTGMSAGSICWFKYGNSDSRKFTSDSNKLIKVTGLGIIEALHCPHYDAELNRETDLKRMMKNTHGLVAIAIDNCCAIEVINDTYRIIKSKPKSKAYKVFWKNNDYYKQEIVAKKEFKKLKYLLYK